MAFYYASGTLVDIAWEIGRREDLSPRQALKSRGIAVHIIDRLLSGKRVAKNTALGISRGLNMPLDSLFSKRKDGHTVNTTVTDYVSSQIKDSPASPATIEKEEVERITVDVEPPTIAHQPDSIPDTQDHFGNLVSMWKRYLKDIAGCHEVSNLTSTDLQTFILMAGRHDG